MDALGIDALGGGDGEDVKEDILDLASKFFGGEVRDIRSSEMKSQIDSLSEDEAKSFLNEVIGIIM